MDRSLLHCADLVLHRLRALLLVAHAADLIVIAIVCWIYHCGNGCVRSLSDRSGLLHAGLGGVTTNAGPPLNVLNRERNLPVAVQSRLGTS